MSLNLDLKGVSSFFVVQADGPEHLDTTISDEKELKVLGDAIALLQKSEAPVRYLRFHHDGMLYRLYPVEDSDEYVVDKKPILN